MDWQALQGVIPPFALKSLLCFTHWMDERDNHTTVINSVDLPNHYLHHATTLKFLMLSFHRVKTGLIYCIIPEFNQFQLYSCIMYSDGIRTQLIIYSVSVRHCIYINIYSLPFSSCYLSEQLCRTLCRVFSERCQEGGTVNGFYNRSKSKHGLRAKWRGFVRVRSSAANLLLFFLRGFDSSSHSLHRPYIRLRWLQSS